VLSFLANIIARVAQWIRAFASGAKGRRFDPCRGYQKTEVRSQRSEIRSQRSEVRGQRSEVRSQKSEVRGQKSEIRCQKSVGSLDHASEHLARFPAQGCKFIVLLARDVKTVLCKVQGGISFTVLTIAIRQLADEVGFISPLRPSLTQVQSYRTL
jgi:hypothetical protein